MRVGPALVACLLLVAGGLYHSSQPSGVRERPFSMIARFSHVSSLSPADIGSVGREVVGGFLLNLLWKWRGGGEREMTRC